MFQNSESTATEPDISGAATTSKENQSTSQHLEQPEHYEQQTADVQETEPPDNIGNSTMVPTSTPKSESKTNSLQIGRKGRKRSLNTFVSGTQEAIKQLKTLSDENKYDANEFDVFCESLAIQLKKIPLKRALVCQEKLQSVMTQERLFQLTSYPQSRPSTSSSSYSADYNQEQSGAITSEVYSEMPSPAHSIHPQQSQNHHQFCERGEYFEELESEIHDNSNVLSEALSSAGITLHDVTML